MTTNKTFHFFLISVFVIAIYIISLFLGGFVVGKDATMSQIVIYLSVLLGMILYYFVDFLVRKYP